MKFTYMYIIWMYADAPILTSQKVHFEDFIQPKNKYAHANVPILT